MEDIYKNDIVINANTELKTIRDNLIVQSIGGSEGRICSLSTSFPLKGNKEIITSLENLGWEKTRRFKCRTDGNWNRNQYDGYEMYQGMAKYFRQEN